MAILTLEQVRKDLDERRGALSEDIASGLPSFNEYNRAVGAINGLDAAIGLIDRYIDRLTGANEPDS